MHLFALFCLACPFLAPSGVHADNDEDQAIRQCHERLSSNTSRCLSDCVQRTSEAFSCLIILHEDSGSVPSLDLYCGQKAPFYCCPIWHLLECIEQSVDRECARLKAKSYMIYYYGDVVEGLNYDQCRGSQQFSEHCARVQKQLTDHQIPENGESDEFSSYYFYKYFNVSEATAVLDRANVDQGDYNVGSTRIFLYIVGGGAGVAIVLMMAANKWESSS